MRETFADFMWRRYFELDPDDFGEITGAEFLKMMREEYTDRGEDQAPDTPPGVTLH